MNLANDRLLSAEAALADFKAQLAAVNPPTGNPAADYFGAESIWRTVQISPQMSAVTAAQGDVTEASLSMSFASSALSNSQAAASRSFVAAVIAGICLLIAALLAWFTVRVLKTKAARAGEYLSRDAASRSGA